MHQIGVVSTSGAHSSKYVEALKSSDLFELFELSMNNEEMSIKDLDGLIIQADSENDVGKICELLMEIRKQSSLMIWIFSDHLPKSTRLILLQLGADGIVDSQIDLEEYLLMLKNTLCHGRAENGYRLSKETEKAELELIPSNLSVMVGGDTEIPLTRLEFRTIEFLYEKKLEAVSYEKIYQKVWKNKPEHENSKFRVANLIFHLRRKIEKNPLKPEYIKTIRSKGYMLNV